MANYITLSVREDVFPQTLAFYASALSAAPPAGSSPPQRPVSATDDWSESELRKLFDDSGGRMRKVITLLVDRGGEPVSGDDIAKAIGIADRGHSVAGMMGALGRRIKHRHQGRWPFEAKYNALDERWEYTMPKRNADLLRAIVRAR